MKKREKRRDRVKLKKREKGKRVIKEEVRRSFVRGQMARFL